MYSIQNNLQNATRFKRAIQLWHDREPLTLFKKRHLLDEDRVDGIFRPRSRRRDAVLVLGKIFLIDCNISSVMNSCCKVATSTGMMPLHLVDHQ